MADLWIPEGPRHRHDPAPRKLPSGDPLWGSYSTNVNPKVVLHTTESTVYWPGQATYYGHHNWPHGTLFAHGQTGLWTFAQHIPFNFSARALKNTPGGVETNRLNVVQIEIAWRAEHIRDLPVEALVVLAEVLKFLHAKVRLPLTSTVTWKPYPASYGKNNGVRLTGDRWLSYSGVLGHEHVDENDHGDPGDFPWKMFTAIMESDMGIDLSKKSADEVAGAVHNHLTFMAKHGASDPAAVPEPDFASMVAEMAIRVRRIEEQMRRMEEAALVSSKNLLAIFSRMETMLTTMLARTQRSGVAEEEEL